MAFEGQAPNNPVNFACPPFIQTRSSTCARTAVHQVSLPDDLLHSDNWDLMFMEHLVGGITMHKPLVPPKDVLTLGNGFDFWAIRAAQEWSVCIQ
jgi:hypothetical protein